MTKLLTTIKRFCATNKGHTTKALEHTLAVADHMLEQRDWTVAATLITNVDKKMGKQIRAILLECIGGITMAADKNHTTGMRCKLGDNFGATEKLGVLRDLVEAKTTIYSKQVDEGLLGKTVADKVVKSQEDVINHITKYALSHGFTITSIGLENQSDMELVNND